MYKIHWFDITTRSNETMKKPYSQHLSKCWTVGNEIKKDKDTLLVIFGGNEEDGDVCFDAIPLACVIKIEEL